MTLIVLGKWMLLGGLALLVLGCPVFIVHEELGELLGRLGCSGFVLGGAVFALGCLAGLAGVSV